jgi:hypothetical protein
MLPCVRQALQLNIDGVVSIILFSTRCKISSNSRKRCWKVKPLISKTMSIFVELRQPLNLGKIIPVFPSCWLYLMHEDPTQHTASIEQLVWLFEPFCRCVQRGQGKNIIFFCVNIAGAGWLRNRGLRSWTNDEPRTGFFFLHNVSQSHSILVRCKKQGRPWRREDSDWR